MREKRTTVRDGKSETEKQGISLRADLVTGYFSLFEQDESEQIVFCTSQIEHQVFSGTEQKH